MGVISKIVGGEATRNEVRKRFAPWFHEAITASGLRPGQLSQLAREPKDERCEAFEIKSTQIVRYASGASAPTKDRVVRLAQLLRVSVTDALWYSYPHRLIAIAEEIANGGGNPQRLRRRLGSAQEWAQSVMKVPVAHAAALLYCYLGPARPGELPIRSALLKESASHQAQYMAVLAHAKGGRMNPTLEMAEMVLKGAEVNFLSRVAAAGFLVMPWAISVAQPLFEDVLKGWPVTSLPVSTALSDRISAQIKGNSSGTLTLTHRLGRPGDGKRPA